MGDSITSVNLASRLDHLSERPDLTFTNIVNAQKIGPYMSVTLPWYRRWSWQMR